MNGDRKHTNMGATESQIHTVTYVLAVSGWVYCKPLTNWVNLSRKTNNRILATHGAATMRLSDAASRTPARVAI